MPVSQIGFRQPMVRFGLQTKPNEFKTIQKWVREHFPDAQVEKNRTAVYDWAGTDAGALAQQLNYDCKQAAGPIANQYMQTGSSDYVLLVKNFDEDTPEVLAQQLEPIIRVTVTMQAPQLYYAQVTPEAKAVNNGQDVLVKYNFSA